ncbi:hypothetical protein K2173_019693 [Erythroxylum novogranatense]|uniref:Uncharacterized protein n=1 Tax=Erythroxylum novogranatense TaxID=1862640 RepID=A0AAV8SMU4_9ROSI|nr:hypothetical protein K2173_019693 [Erythroxylum novogranatense]
MEDIAQELKPTPFPGKSKLRCKSAKPMTVELPSSAASKRGSAAGAASKRVSVLNVSGKEKSAKPPRRLSIPAQSVPSPVPKPALNNTPIPHARTKSSNIDQAKREAPLRLSSAAYWLSQIKLSDSASMHSVSLGFFKLALEAGCKPIQQMRNELKSYVRHHELSEAEGVTELFDSYNISVTDHQEQVQVSETGSKVPGEGTRPSDDEVHSSSSRMGTGKPRPRSLNADAAQEAESAKKETAEKHSIATRTRVSLSKNANVKSVRDNVAHKSQKKLHKPNKLEAGKEKDRIKKPERNSAAYQGSVSPSPAVSTPEENKENVVALPTEEIGQTEA